MATRLPDAPRRRDGAAPVRARTPLARFVGRCSSRRTQHVVPRARSLGRHVAAVTTRRQRAGLVLLAGFVEPLRARLAALLRRVDLAGFGRGSAGLATLDFAGLVLAGRLGQPLAACLRALVRRVGALGPLALV